MRASARGLCSLVSDLFVVIVLASSASAQVQPPRTAHTFVNTGETPFGAVYDRARDRIYATVPRMNKVVVISGSNHKIVSEIRVPNPAGIDLLPGDKLVVGAGGSNDFYQGLQVLFVIDRQTNEIVDRRVIPAEGTYGAARAPRRLLTLNNGIVVIRMSDPGSTASRLVFWNSATGEFRNYRPIEVTESYLAFRSAEGNRLLLTSEFGLVTYDPETDAVVGTSDLRTWVAAVSPHGDRIAAIKDQTLYLLDGALHEIRQTSIPLHTLEEVLFSDDGSRLYVQYGEASVVAVLDANTLDLLGSFPLLDKRGPGIERHLIGFDGHGCLFGGATYGLLFHDLRTISSDPAPPDALIYTAPTVTPGAGVQVGGTPVTISGAPMTVPDTVYFGLGAATNVQMKSQFEMTATTPAAAEPGAVDVLLQYANGVHRVAPEGFSYGPVILFTSATGGAASGGDDLVIAGYGFGKYPSDVQVTIGGNTATVKKVALPAISSFAALPMQSLLVTVPPGVPGAADIRVVTQTGSTVKKDGFRYYRVETTPSTKQPGAIVYDRWRHVVYETNDELNRVDVIDPEQHAVTRSFSCGTGPAGVALTPDGAKLLVANWTSRDISVIDLATGMTSQIPLPTIYAHSSPETIAATASNKALVGIVDDIAVNLGYLAEVDLATGVLRPVPPPDALSGVSADIELHAFDKGRQVLVGFGGRRGGGGGQITTYSAATGELTAIPTSSGFTDSAVVDDGSVIATNNVFNDPSGNQFSRTEWSDAQHWNTHSVLGRTFHPGGGLLFSPWTNGTVFPDEPRYGGIVINDVQTGAELGFIAVSNGIFGALRSLDVDETGNKLFVTGDQGLLMIDLSPVPLTVGHVVPPRVREAGGTEVIIRGSGFVPGATVAFNGTPVSTAYVDGNTLTALTPALSAGPVAVTVTNPDTTTYRLAVGFSAYSSTPEITAVNPGTLDVGVGPIATMIFGQSLVPGTVVQFNSADLATTWTTDELAQVTVPAEALAAEGTGTFTARSPAGIVSNSFAVPLRYPPGHFISPASWWFDPKGWPFGNVAVGTPFSQEVSIINGGMGPLFEVAISASGIDFSQSSDCPGQLDPKASCTITVTFTPAGEGGRAGTLTIASRAESKTIAMSGYGMSAAPHLLSQDGDLALGGQSLWFGESASGVVRLINTGVQTATITKVEATPPFAATTSCSTVAGGANESCDVNVTFTPTAPGPVTGTLRVESNSANSPLAVVLTGSSAYPLRLQSDRAEILSIRGGQVASTFITLVNLSQKISTTVTSASAPSGFTVVNNCQDVAANSNCHIDVMSQTATGGIFTGSVTVVTPGDTFQVPLRATIQDFTIAAAAGTATTQTISAGQTAQYRIALQGFHTYSGAVGLSCTGVPAFSYCQVTPAGVSIDSSGAIFGGDVRVTTTGPSAGVQISRHTSTPTGWPLLAMGLSLLAWGALSNRRKLLLGAAATLALIVIVSCGGGNNNPPPPPKDVTPSGTYTITVTAKDSLCGACAGGVQRSTAFTLIVR